MASEHNGGESMIGGTGWAHLYQQTGNRDSTMREVRL